MTTTRIEAGTTLPTAEFTVTRRDLVRYAGASGDVNPVHQDDQATERVGLPGVIAHGMPTMGLAARVLTAWAGEGTVVGYRARFRRPVVVPADGAAVVAVEGVVRSVSPDGLVHVELTVRCGVERALAGVRATVRCRAAGLMAARA